MPKKNYSNSSLNINTVTPITNIKLENVIQEEGSQEIETIDDDSFQEQMDIRVDIEPPIVNYINLDHSYCQSDTSIKGAKRISTELQDDNIAEEYEFGNCSLREDVMQTVKKRKPQQSLLKTSILKKIKAETADEGIVIL